MLDLKFPIVIIRTDIEELITTVIMNDVPDLKLIFTFNFLLDFGVVIANFQQEDFFVVREKDCLKVRGKLDDCIFVKSSQIVDIDIFLG